jgi:hypothetical protein
VWTSAVRLVRSQSKTVWLRVMIPMFEASPLPPERRRAILPSSAHSIRHPPKGSAQTRPPSWVTLRVRKPQRDLYNAAMPNGRHGPGWLCTLLLLVIVLYPALVLECRVAPSIALRSVPPWSADLGPYPQPSPLAFEAATGLGPRLACIARDVMGVAVWNPAIGGGRPGWLSSPREGGAPLALAAAVLARAEWAWTTLLALQLLIALGAAYWALSLLGLAGWPASVGATIYALSGAVCGHWLDWQGSALSLGPLALVAALQPARNLPLRAAKWSIILAILVWCGPPAMAFAALGLTIAVIRSDAPTRRIHLLALTVAVPIVLALVLPRAWLVVHGGEPTATSTAVRTPPATGVDSLVRVGDSSQPGTPRGEENVRASLGLSAVLLGMLGLTRLPWRQRVLWLSLLGIAIAVELLPLSSLERLELAVRPYGVVALVGAVLAAFGCEQLLNRCASTWRGVVGIAVWLLVLSASLPAAARAVPYAHRHDVDLPVEGSDLLSDATTLSAGLLAVFPPDVAAGLGVADVRARWFVDEPSYERLLGADANGAIPVARALDPGLAQLGARWLLEPLPLRVISGEVFSRLEVADAANAEARSIDGLSRRTLVVPRLATRLGIPARGVAEAGAWLERPGLRRQLEADPVLSQESTQWKWFTVPEGWPEGNATLATSEAIADPASPVPVAWDATGVRLRHEGGGLRVWESERALPLVAVPAGTRVSVREIKPSRLAADIETDAPTNVVIRVKYRPRLWRARCDDQPVATTPAEQVWTAIAVPAGKSRIVVAASLPLPVWLTQIAAALVLVALALFWRSR